MTRTQAIQTAALAFLSALAAADPPAALPPTPTNAQLAWQRAELTLFIHFGPNTFTDREWGDGGEDPDVFHPTELDCRQWARTAREAGFKLAILTAKHHDGFCLWPTAQTEHCVRSSDWQDGRGDVMRAFVDAFRAEGLKVGFYLSPWDRHDKRYGTPAYNDYFVAQLRELLTGYAPIDEVWFDGAREGEGTPYDWKRIYQTVYDLAPQALIAIMGPDVRWVGNESGVARVGESSVQPASDAHAALGRAGPVWHPAECDVSIRPGWFWHASEDGKVKGLDTLVDIYFKSVGRNSVLLLNVPPNREGRFADPDVRRLREFGAAIRDLHASELARSPDATASASDTRGGGEFAAGSALDGDLDTYWATPDDARSAALTLDLGAERAFNVVNVQEEIRLGERVRAYRVDAWIDDDWQEIGRGTIIGQRNLLRTRAVSSRRVRLVIEQAAAGPAIAEFGLMSSPFRRGHPSGSLARGKPATASDVHGGSVVYAAAGAFDDDEETRWATNDGVSACWIEVDLGTPQPLARLEVAEWGRVRRFELLVRDTAEQEWATAHKGTTLGPKFAADFPPVRARFVRLNILEAEKPPTINEIRLFGPK